MKSSKLIQTLQSFSEEEFKLFEKFAHQKFFSNEKMYAFIDFLAYQFPHFSDEECTKEAVYKFIFQDDNYRDIKVRELMATLNKALKDFLVLENVRESNFYYELALLEQYHKRDLEAHYKIQLKTIQKIIAKDQFENAEYFRRKFLLAEIENEHFANKHLRTLDNNIQLKLDNLDFYYFSIKLKESCEMLNRQRMLNQSYQFNLFEEIEQLIEKNKDSYLKYATILCYYQIYKLLLSKDDTNQLNLCLDTLEKHAHKFSGDELKAMYDFPQNYCIAQINAGNTKYIDLLFNLQGFLLDKSFNMQGGYISQISYRNIVTLGLKLNKYEWSNVFIEKYKNKVAPEHRENSYNMCKANLYFALEDYDKTIQLLNQVTFSDVYFAYYSKVILLKTYYAISEFETLSYFITAFKLYLKRNKQMPINYKKGADLFLSYFKKIFNIAEKIDYLDTKKVKEKLEKISSDIQAEKNIHNRVWLLECIQKLS